MVSLLKLAEITEVNGVVIYCIEDLKGLWLL